MSLVVGNDFNYDCRASFTSLSRSCPVVARMTSGQSRQGENHSVDPPGGRVTVPSATNGHEAQVCPPIAPGRISSLIVREIPLVLRLVE